MATLSDIVLELEIQNEISQQRFEQQEKQNTLLIDMVDGQGSADRLQALEDKGEIQNKVGLRPSGATVAGDTGGGGFFSGIGSMFGSILKGPLKFLMKPIKALSKLLRVGGPIALIIGGLYALFNDISENENFKKSVDTIKTLWNDNIVPAFQGIKDTISALSGNADIQATFESIGNWFSNFKIQIQDWLLANLVIITETIAGVLEGVDLLLKGEWMAGLSTIGTTLFNGIKNLFDAAITNLLEIFGVDFGESGTFLGAVQDTITALTTKLSDIWNGVSTWVSDKWTTLTDTLKNFWTDLSNFFTNPETEGSIPYMYNAVKTSISESITNIKNSISSFFTNAYDNVVTGVDNALTSLTSFFTNAYDNVVTGVDNALTSFFTIADEKITAVKDAITSIPTKIASWATGFFDLITGLLPDVGALAAQLQQQLVDLLPNWAKNLIGIDDNQLSTDQTNEATLATAQDSLTNLKAEETKLRASSDPNAGYALDGNLAAQSELVKQIEMLGGNAASITPTETLGENAASITPTETQTGSGLTAADVAAGIREKQAQVVIINNTLPGQEAGRGGNGGGGGTGLILPAPPTQDLMDPVAQ